MGNTYSRIAPQSHPKTLDVSTSNYSPVHESARENAVLQESVFHAMLKLERLRAKRSRKAFVLMLLDAKSENGKAPGILNQVADVALTTKRETDLAGWYVESVIFGIIFTEVNLEGDRTINETLRVKIETALSKRLGPERAAKIAISLFIFPESEGKNYSSWIAETKPYQDLGRKPSRKTLPLALNER